MYRKLLLISFIFVSSLITQAQVIQILKFNKTTHDFGTVKDALDAAGLEAANAEVTRLPENTSELDAKSAEKLLRLVDNLEDLDDTQDVFHNADIPEEVLETMG